MAEQLEAMPAAHPEAEGKNLTCGSCQWFTAGYKGNHCQKRRGVDHHTLACKEYTLPLEDPFMDIIQDKYIQGIRRNLRTNRFKVDVSITEELRSAVIGDDLIQGTFGSKQDLEGIAEVLRKVISLRSRVSTIYTSLLDVKHEMEEVIQHCHMWLYSKYSSHMKELKNDTMRKSAIHRVLPELMHLQKVVEGNLALAKYTDDRLDANERTLSKIIGSSEKLYFSKRG